jgi:hypothetical protein
VRQLATSLDCCRCQDARRHRQSSTRAQRHRRPTSSRPPPPQALMTLPAIALLCSASLSLLRARMASSTERRASPPTPK